MGKQSDHLVRQYWGKQNLKLPEIDLSKAQIESYNWFLKDGIREALAEINPIEDFTGQAYQLEFVDHYVGKAHFSPDECVRKGITYEAPLRVKATLTNLAANTRKTQEIFLGD